MKTYASITKGLNKLRSNLLKHAEAQLARAAANEAKIEDLEDDTAEARFEAVRSEKTASKLSALLGE